MIKRSFFFSFFDEIIDEIGIARFVNVRTHFGDITGSLPAFSISFSFFSFFSFTAVDLLTEDVLQKSQIPQVAEKGFCGRPLRPRTF